MGLDTFVFLRGCELDEAETFYVRSAALSKVKLVVNESGPNMLIEVPEKDVQVHLVQYK